MSTRTSQFTLVCFQCRYTAKSGWVGSGSRRCPTCKGALENVGKHFRVPAKKDANGWRSSEAFFRQQRAMDRPDFWVARSGEQMKRKWAARRQTR